MYHLRSSYRRTYFSTRSTCVSTGFARHRQQCSLCRPHAAAPAPPERRTSFDQQLVGSLEKQLGSRPNKDELVDRNILKGTSTSDDLTRCLRCGNCRPIDDSVAPALQAAKERLEKAQLQVSVLHLYHIVQRIDLYSSTTGQTGPRTPRTT